jgi:monothiol glutaredoxin
MSTETSIFSEIQSLIDQHAVILFMKGMKEAPMCGFSAQVCQILNRYGVEYVTVNVLASPELREGIKTFTNWPTIPQLYVRGQFIGGCDIIREMNDAGELIALFEEQQIPFQQ